MLLIEIEARPMRKLSTMIILEKRINIELVPATVAKIDSYVTTGVFVNKAFLPFSVNKPCANVVFQLQQSGTTLPLSVKNVQLPLYNEQQVDVIKANECIIGYVDVKSEEYYYTTSDFCKAAGVHFLELLTWLVSIMATISILTIIKNNYALLFACGLLISTWVVNIFIKHLLNKKIENIIDNSMKMFSIL